MALTKVVASMVGGATAGTQALAPTVPIIENIQTVSSSYTITSGSSAVSAGPISVAGGASVTVPGGSRWIIL